MRRLAVFLGIPLGWWLMFANYRSSGCISWGNYPAICDGSGLSPKVLLGGFGIFALLLVLTELRNVLKEILRKGSEK